MKSINNSVSNIYISNKSEDDMKKKYAEVINNFNNKKFINQLKTSLKFRGEGNGIYKKQEELKMSNPENLKKNVDFIKSFIEHNENIRKANINNFKVKSINEPDFYDHKSDLSQYAKDPDLHFKKYTENFQNFSNVYTDYIKNSLPKENYVKDSNFC